MDYLNRNHFDDYIDYRMRRKHRGAVVRDLLNKVEFDAGPLGLGRREHPMYGSLESLNHIASPPATNEDDIIYKTTQGISSAYQDPYLAASYRYPYSATMKELAQDLNQDRTMRGSSEVPIHVGESYVNQVSPPLRSEARVYETTLRDRPSRVLSLEFLDDHALPDFYRGPTRYFGGHTPFYSRPLGDYEPSYRRSLDNLLSTPPPATPTYSEVKSFYNRPKSAYEMLPHLHELKRNSDFPFRPYYSARSSYIPNRGANKRVGIKQPDWGYIIGGICTALNPEWDKRHGNQFRYVFEPEPYSNLRDMEMFRISRGKQYDLLFNRNDTRKWDKTPAFEALRKEGRELAMRKEENKRKAMLEPEEDDEPLLRPRRYLTKIAAAPPKPTKEEEEYEYEEETDSTPAVPTTAPSSSRKNLEPPSQPQVTMTPATPVVEVPATPQPPATESKDELEVPSTLDPPKQEEVPVEEPKKEEAVLEEQKSEESPKEDAPQEEPVKEEAPKEAPSKEEAVKEEAPKEEPVQEEAPKEEAPKEESSKEETQKEDIAKEETSKEEVTTEEAPKEVAPQEETPKEDSTKDTEAAKTEELSPDNVKTPFGLKVGDEFEGGIVVDVTADSYSMVSANPPCVEAPQMAEAAPDTVVKVGDVVDGGIVTEVTDTSISMLSADPPTADASEAPADEKVENAIPEGVKVGDELNGGIVTEVTEKSVTAVSADPPSCTEEKVIETVTEKEGTIPEGLKVGDEYEGGIVTEITENSISCVSKEPPTITESVTEKTIEGGIPEGLKVGDEYQGGIVTEITENSISCVSKDPPTITERQIEGAIPEGLKVGDEFEGGIITEITENSISMVSANPPSIEPEQSGDAKEPESTS